MPGVERGARRREVRDVVVVGAGPAGLAAAVYAGSEGLDVLVLESMRPAARPDRARRSRTTWASRPGSRAMRSPAARTRRPRSSAPRSRSRARAAKLECERRPYGRAHGRESSARAPWSSRAGREYRKPEIAEPRAVRRRRDLLRRDRRRGAAVRRRGGDRRRRRKLGRSGGGVPGAHRAQRHVIVRGAGPRRDACRAT